MATGRAKPAGAPLQETGLETPYLSSFRGTAFARLKDQGRAAKNIAAILGHKFSYSPVTILPSAIRKGGGGGRASRFHLIRAQLLGLGQPPLLESKHGAARHAALRLTIAAILGRIARSSVPRMCACHILFNRSDRSTRFFKDLRPELVAEDGFEPPTQGL